MKCVVLATESEGLCRYMFDWFGGNIRQGLHDCGTVLPIHTSVTVADTEWMPWPAQDTVYRQQLINPLSACMAVFVARLLLMCMDIERNPGPVSACGPRNNYTADGTDTWTHGSNGYVILAPLHQYPPPTDMFTTVMQKLEATTNDIGTLNVWCRQLQTENDQLSADVQYLSTKCYDLEQRCNASDDRQEHLSRMAANLDDHIDKLEAFSRRNNVRFLMSTRAKTRTTIPAARKLYGS